MPGEAVEIRITIKRSGPGVGSLIASLQSRCDQAAADTASAIVSTASMLAPKRTGYLAQSISSSSTGSLHTVVVGAYYGIYVEYGTRYMLAQPYFHPAIEMEKARMAERFRGVFN